MRQNYQISEQFPSIQEEEALGFPIFARKYYWLLHLQKEELRPITVRNQKLEIVAFWCFCRIGDRLLTPFNAPFFTPYLLKSVKQEILFSEVIDYLRKKDGGRIQFMLRSDLDFELLQTLVPSLKILNVEVGTQLIVEKNSFLEQIVQKRKKRKLNSISADDSFVVKEVPLKHWKKVYEQNVIWRKQKGHENIVGIGEMEEAKRQFPEHYHAFQLLKDEELVGTAFFLKVDSDLIYVYSLVTAPLSDEKEPALLLWKAIYDWAELHKIPWIDMGTSMSSAGKINRNLLRYKQFIGGLVYKKYTLEC
jgi:hypothetical protein